MERDDLLLGCATVLGASWAQGLCDELRREQRPLAGGFPGTIPEVRWRVGEYLRGELARQELSPLEPNELARAVDVAYARARREWIDAGRATHSAARKAHDHT